MRLLFIADEEHLSAAIHIAQALIGEDPGNSITITDEEGSGALIDSDGYNYVVKNPTMDSVMKLIKRGFKC
jgi:hypothetical protein